ncbi:TniQ family protein [Labrys monachus]|uniref:Transposase/DNA-directed RNA polymerase subunit RPC12/RpoP n=1 Tax=Labrys monachus TaxID=217067 RepID=A0ABU0FGJ0_9HYPH|nr:TniQ family protein [Labrys monachus]MDQ0393492.1 transposase/DNA-directed RNA polymerase subunit RPC12/RpoP [Labrys monachus]MDQ0393732.1 transposase/DNA-directed RNA polymerase subunit RPC12/RpoP [Labrys monachus]
MPWSEKDLFEVELFDPPAGELAIVQRPKLPGVTVPLRDEALASWLLRYAEPFGVSPEDLLLRRADIELAGRGDWWRRPPPALLEHLAQATGVDAMVLTELTLWPGDEETDDPRDRFAGLRFRAQGATSRRKRRIAVCPHCLMDDPVPYVRRDWATGWTMICPDHSEVLVGACPECGHRLKLPALSSQDYFAPDRCTHCGFRLTAMAAREAHPAAVALHRQLRAAHDSGTFVMPDRERLAWPEAIALFDVLLGAIWIETRPVTRRRLFERIERDFGPGTLGPEPAGSYEGLLILAWILDGWPDRVRTTIAIVQGPRPRRQLDRWQHLDGATRQVLLDLLLAIWPDQKHPDDRAWWRDWIENLPESGDELRARAAIDRFPHRRARLMALADVRDGMPVELAAEAAGIIPRTLYIWLKRGAKAGLESALDRQRGALNQAQAVEIAQWIAEAPTNQPHWRSNRVRNEIFRRFGLEVSLEVASRLLRKHGPWVRRRVSAPRRWSRDDARFHD